MSDAPDATETAEGLAAKAERRAMLHDGFAASQSDRIRGPYDVTAEDHRCTARLFRALVAAQNTALAAIAAERDALARQLADARAEGERLREDHGPKLVQLCDRMIVDPSKVLYISWGQRKRIGADGEVWSLSVTMANYTPWLDYDSEEAAKAAFDEASRALGLSRAALAPAAPVMDEEAGG